MTPAVRQVVLQAQNPPICVDSVAGSDSNLGTQGSPYQTLAKAQAIASATKKRILLKRGSTWREQFTVPVSGLSISVYGLASDPMPIIDGADVATTWTQPDVVTYPNVWSRSWTRASAAPGVTETLGLWLNGARPRYAASLADLQANGGWFATSLITQTTTVYIKSASDPNSSGDLYEITKRDFGIAGHSSTLGTSRATTITGPIEIKRCVGHFNGLTKGPGTAKQIFVRDGTGHHVTTEGDVSEDFVATEYSPATVPSCLVAYTTTGTGFAHTFRRCHALLPGGADRLSTGPSGFYGHASVPTTIDRLTLEACASRGVAYGNSDSTLFEVLGGYAEDPYAAAITVTSASNLIKWLMIRETVASLRVGGSSAIKRLVNTYGLDVQHGAFVLIAQGTLVQVSGAGSAVSFSNTAFVSTINAAVLAGFTSPNLCVPSVNNCIMWGGQSYNFFDVGYAGNNNVFCFFQSGQSQPRMTWNGTLYTALNTFQAASGQDSNSVFCKFADQVSGNGIAFWKGVADGTNAGPAAGDFRINPSAKVYNGAGGALTGTFADGTTAITLAGPQEHYDWNLRSVVAGPPSRYPVLPATIAEMRSYDDNPSGWNFYP